ncbi:MAG: alpha/beta hydrolase [Verrucomicrobiaceae bacterium]|nr:alpha/beta hydrolase [Verrucomicrobiaceae bacterium]
MRPFIPAILLVVSTYAAEPVATRDVFYTEAKDKLQSLDVYSPATGGKHPVIVWIHGGGWKKGDKAGLQQKPQAFVDKGFVLVSVNYRFIPDVTLKTMMGDIANGLRWTHEHIAEHQGDPNQIIVMGHSAGAHLAALICTDDGYLKAAGVPMSCLRGCVPIDVSAYDLPKRLKEGGSVPPATYTAIFGETEAEHREFSPVYHIAKGKGIPPFLILHVASREDTKAQSHWFADKLKDAGVAARVVAGENKTHGSISTDLGGADDPPTLELWKFFSEIAPTGGTSK